MDELAIAEGLIDAELDLCVLDLMPRLHHRLTHTHTHTHTHTPTHTHTHTQAYTTQVCPSA
jgi:hypothetical protein